MRIKLSYLLCFFFLAETLCSCSKKWSGLSMNKVSVKSSTWIFILAGQSNMSGSGNAPLESMDTIMSKRILALTKSWKVQLAKAPIHFNDKIVGLDCGMSFAHELIRNIPDSITILLVPCAVGGTTISQWIGDSLHRDVKLFTNFRNMIDIAKSKGEIKAVLWHQGENDATIERIPFYASRLDTLARMFRLETLTPDLPFLIGELGSFSKNKAEWLGINQAIYTYIKTDPNAKVISTNDLECLPDKVHFNSAAQRTLGRRYAQMYMEHFYKGTK